MSVYSKKLKSPLWQKKKLQVFQRDNWTCQRCKSQETFLVIHYKYYDKKYKNPWDYPLGAFCTLCVDCQYVEYELRAEYEDSLLFQLKAQGFFADDISNFAIAFYLLNSDQPRYIITLILQYILHHPKVLDSVIKKYLSKIKSTLIVQGYES